MTTGGAEIDDAEWMDRALGLARARLGATAPNPAVGCVIVKDGQAIAEAATAPGGRPHAEAQALKAAGAAAAGATLYVTLEPCAHHGRVAPCANAIIAAKVARVVSACRDPDPRVDGKGVAKLEKAGIAVEEGVRRAEAEALNAGFFKRVRTGRPLVAADADLASYDAEFAGDPAADLAAALKALGDQGLTRVRVAPGSALADALKRAGLLDVET